MHDIELAIYLLTWKRPHLLEQTLASLFQQLQAEPGLRVSVNIVNNGTDGGTREVIARYADRLDSVLALRENLGISQAYERLMPATIAAPYVMLSEDDVEYRQPFSQYLRFLETFPDVACVSGFHGPEHRIIDRRAFQDRQWFVKEVLSSVHLVLRTETYQAFRPIVLPDKLNLDWHLFTNTDQSFCPRGLKAAVLPGGARHLGGAESTWGGQRQEPTAEEVDRLADEQRIENSPPRIPRILHQLWIGPQPRPAALMETWRQKHPDWEYIEWNEARLADMQFENQRHIDSLSEWCGKADLMRYEILFRYGGVFVDADSECLRPLSDTFLENDFFACWEHETVAPGLVAVGYLGATPGNRLLRLIMDRLKSLPNAVGGPAWQTVGPQLLSDTICEHAYPATIYPSHWFIPEHHTGATYTGSDPVYARQHWGSTRQNYAELANRSADDERPRQKIPRLLHWVWLGEAPLPKRAVESMAGWERRHPGWRVRLWTEAHLPWPENLVSPETATSLSWQAEIVRCELLSRYGGVVADPDLECLRNIEPLLDGVAAFIVDDREGGKTSPISGSIPGHPLWQSRLRQLADFREHLSDNPTASESDTGSQAELPAIATSAIAFPDVRLLPSHLFVPYGPGEIYRQQESFPQAYAVHRWLRGPADFPESRWTAPHGECAAPQQWHAWDGYATEVEVVELVAAFVRALQPELVLETGTWKGYMALAVAEALRRNGHGRLLTLESDADLARLATALLQPYPQAQVVQTDSKSFVLSEDVQFAWLDTRLENGLIEFRKYYPRLRGIVGFHDTGRHHGIVRDTVELLAAEKLLRPLFLNTPRGVAFAEVLH